MVTHSIYNINVNSSENIEMLINSSDKIREGIFEIQNSKLIYPFTIEEAAIHSSIGDLFYQTYQNCLGIFPESELISEMDRYQLLLKRSIIVCNDILTPHFIHSLKCHKMASFCFSNMQELAISFMTETQDLAKIIAKEYDTISSNYFFNSTVERICLSLGEKNHKIYQKIKTTEDNHIACILSRGASTIDSAINNLFNLRASLSKVQNFWRCTKDHIKTLTDSTLTDRDAVELFSVNYEKKSDIEFTELLKTVERQLNFETREIKDLSEAIKPMKTGRSLYSYEPTPLTDLSKPSESIEQELEKSYLNWLTLAKINFDMIKIMKHAMNGMDIARLEILQLENDTIVKALQNTIQD